MLAYIKPDILSATWGYLSRTCPGNPKSPRQYWGKELPQTIRYNGDHGQINLKKPFMDWFNANNSAQAIKYNWRKGGGWCNSGRVGQVQQLTFRGNFESILGVTGGRAYVDYYQDRGSPSGTWLTNPTQNQLFTAVNPGGDTIDPPCGPLYMFAVARKPLWLPVDELLFFPALPMVVDGLTIVSYSLYGNNAFGVTADGQEILLFSRGYYQTAEWRMTEAPPQEQEQEQTVALAKGAVIRQLPKDSSAKIRKLLKSEVHAVLEDIGDWVHVLEGWVRR